MKFDCPKQTFLLTNIRQGMGTPAAGINKTDILCDTYVSDFCLSVTSLWLHMAPTWDMRCFRGTRITNTFLFTAEFHRSNCILKWMGWYSTWLFLVWNCYLFLHDLPRRRLPCKIGRGNSQWGRFLSRFLQCSWRPPPRPLRIFKLSFTRFHLVFVVATLKMYVKVFEICKYFLLV